jgi:hypothetical protein
VYSASIQDYLYFVSRYLPHREGVNTLFSLEEQMSEQRFFTPAWRKTSPLGEKVHPWVKTSLLGKNFTPGGKPQPWGKTSSQGENFNPREQSSPLGENFTPGGKLHPWGKTSLLGGSLNPGGKLQP